MPYLTVRDADAALDFYARAFGFEKKFVMPGPDGKAGHCEMQWQEATIMFSPESRRMKCQAPRTTGVRSPVSLYVYVPDVDALYQRAVAAGAGSEQEPETMFYGDRTCGVIDPDGHLWYFATNVADFDPAKAPK
jgi:PhnB protein